MNKFLTLILFIPASCIASVSFHCALFISNYNGLLPLLAWSGLWFFIVAFGLRLSKFQRAKHGSFKLSVRTAIVILSSISVEMALYAANPHIFQFASYILLTARCVVWTMAGASIAYDLETNPDFVVKGAIAGFGCGVLSMPIAALCLIG